MPASSLTSTGSPQAEALAPGERQRLVAIPLRASLRGSCAYRHEYSCRGDASARVHASLTRLSRHPSFSAAFIVSGFWVHTAKALAGQLSRFARYHGIDTRISHDFPILFGTGVLLYLLSVAMFYVLLALQDAQEAEARVLQASILAREAELKALKAQVNPHFLFNSLNSISALTSSDAAKAREMCILLGDFLRRTLGLGEKSAIPLEEEMSLISRLSRRREDSFRPARIKMEENIDKEAMDVQVPPLLLQPLVENAVAHGIANLVEGGWIRLDAHCQNGKLSIVVENSFDPEAPPRRRNGVGLANVRQRLAARYPDLASFDVKTTGDCFRVAMTLPAEREVRPA